MNLNDHPAVKTFLATHAQPTAQPAPMDKNLLKEMCIAAGAADVRFVEIDRSGSVEQQTGMRDALPGTATIASLVFRVNREAVRTPYHSLTSLEFRHTWDHANRSARGLVTALEDMGVAALNLSAGFPYETADGSGVKYFWSDKLIAEAAGVGKMGMNRLVIHPVFGSRIVLATVLIKAEVTGYDRPLDYDPCIGCKLCASVCPTGAVGSDGKFDFLSCYFHNYRERVGGFVEWVKHLVNSADFDEYKTKVTEAETVSMWQNLSICPQTKCDRCMAVCPAGERNLGEFLFDRTGYIDRVIKPLQNRAETVYVVPGSAAEARVKEKFPMKTAKYVGL